MKKLFVFIFFMGMVTFLHAQIRAVTETGDEVNLYDDGTWQYVIAENTDTAKISVNQIPFYKGEQASFLLKSKNVNLGVWLNPKKWSFSKSVSNPEAEYELHLKDEDLYGMIVTERLEIPVESLKKIALENGRSVAPDLRIVHEEYRMVNDVKVLLLHMNGTLDGIKFFYYGYYTSNSSGTVQFITYSAQSLFDEYKDECESLLNGIAEIN